jgi:hypothetical protein
MITQASAFRAVGEANLAEAQTTLIGARSMLKELAGIMVHEKRATDAWEDDDDDTPGVSEEQQAMLKSFLNARRDKTTRQLMAAEQQAIADIRVAKRNATQVSLVVAHRWAHEAVVEARRSHLPRVDRENERWSRPHRRWCMWAEVARDQACFDTDMEVALLAERARLDAARAEDHAWRRWEEGRRDRDMQELMSISRVEHSA